MDIYEDDFGDLYADVEVQACSAINAISFPASLSAKVEGEEGPDEKTSELNPEHKSNSASDLNKLDSIADEPACIGDVEADGSDSDDDLNIVLNDDDDCQRVLVGRKDGIDRCEDDDGEEFVTKEVKEGGRSGLGRSKKGLNGYGCDKAFKGGYNLQYTQYKHARLHGLAFPSNTKATELVGLASGFSMPSGGDWEANGCNQQKSLLLSHASDTRTAANLVVPQCRYGFSLPWYRTILDVNIDAFEQKPWRHPGVDITDYFNFDFNEDSWKQYCSSLAFSEYKQENVDQENEDGVGPSASFDDSKERHVNLPKGRAISVRGSSGERQPSMDVRQPRNLNSDVVIQIPLHDSAEDSCGSGKEQLDITNGAVHEASEYEEPNVDDNKDIHSSGRADQLLVLEGNMRSSSGCFALKRCSKSTTGFDQMSMNPDYHGTDLDDDVDGYSHENLNSHASEGIEKDIEGVKNTKGEVGGKTCRSDPCITETDLSPGDRSHFSPTSSCFSGDSEASKDSVRGDLEEPGSPLRRPSLNSNSELLDSVTSSRKNNIRNGTESKPYYSKKYSRSRSPFQEKQKCRIRGINKHAKRHIYLDSDEDAFLMSDAEDLHQRDYSSVDCDRRMERLTDFHSYDREVFLHDRLTETSCGHGSGRSADGYRQTFHTKYPRRKVHQNFRGGMDRHVRKYWDEKEDYHESSIVDDADNRDHNWHHGGRRLSAENRIYRMYGRSRELVSRHSSAFKERETQCRGGRLSDRKRTEFRHCLLEYKHEDYFMPEKYGARISLADERRDALDKSYRTFTPSVEREVNMSGQRGRYVEDSSLDLDGSWRGEIGDEHWGHQDHQSLSSWFHQKPGTDIRGTWHDTMSSRNETDTYRRYRRYTLNEEDRNGGPFGSFNEATDSEVRTIYHDDNVNGVKRKYSWRSKTLHSVDDKSMRHGYNEVHAEEPFYSHENSPAVERFSDRCRYANGRILKLERPRRKMIREGSSANSVNRHSIISYRSEQEQTVLNCRESVGLNVGEGKSGRYSDRRSLICNGRFDKKVMNFSKELTASMDFNECRSGKEIQTDAAETVINQRKDQLHGEFPVPEPSADMDIEEGQIITEQNMEDHFMVKHDTKYAAQTENMKKRMLRDENAFDGSKDARGYDNQHILETLAKMEKRRERFKIPVPLKKEPEKPSEPQSELMVDAAEIRQQRPARKRRWGGS
ncbi:hypothetical protein HS088_TW14G01215 [Tripterygium wilfordii]|uniref:Pre-mRNA polyadenylation factor Fip1 domain-containing protein n=1 Tax=Tripterygium wilfordii TaxID=458696 RepID=A0A7J7CSW9_TRIWF|nr:FIP1[III]-like protein [Tripterygium wilfordii]KAF5737059.1 hypothetical protein HS088_TW14G01215 [Tripterygium wilfordii]